MYDIKPLELEWKKYRKKRQKPWYIGGVIFILLTLLVIAFYGNIQIDFSRMTAYFNTIKSNDLPIVKEVNSHALVDIALDTIEIEKPIGSDKIEDKKVTKVEKSAVAEVVSKKESNAANILVDIPILDEKQKPIEEIGKAKKKKVHINIVETSSVVAYEDVEKRFLQSRDIDDSLFLAASYYKKGLYKKAEYWALETNKLDADIEEGLLIFAKAKAKLGHKNEAESILTSYIAKTASQEAKNVLFRIKNDTL